MGQGASSEEYDRKLYNPSEFQEIIRGDERQRNGMQLFKRNNATMDNDFCAAIYVTIQDESNIDKILQELGARQRLVNDNLVKLINFNFVKQDEFCSTFYKIGLFYEYLSWNLKNEIEVRTSSQRNFQESELWYLLESLIKVALYLKESGIAYGDIRPFNVLISQNGQVKLGEMYQNVQPLSAYSQLIQGSLLEFYISPQLFSSLQNQDLNPKYEPFKSDLYSIGMTILEAATLQNVSNFCYDTASYKIKQGEVAYLLNIVKAQYGENLFNILSQILIEDEFQRPSIEEIQRSLSLIYTNKIYSITSHEALFSSGQIAPPAPVFTQNVQQSVEDETVKRSVQSAATFQKVEESPMPVRESYTQEAIVYPPPRQTVETVAYSGNDDLNARIQAALALSRETMTRYQGNTTSYSTTIVPSTTTYYATNVPQTTTTYNTSIPQATVTTYNTTIPSTATYTTTYAGNYQNAPIDAKASQIETRTYLNQSTNNIETKNYINGAKLETSVIQPASENVEETVKRAARSNVQVESTIPSTSANTYTTYTNVNPVTYTSYQVTNPEEKNYTYVTGNYQVTNPEEKNYTYVTGNYQVSNPEEKNFTYTTSTYQPTYTTKVYETNLSSAYDNIPADNSATQQVTEYKTYSTVLQGSDAERDAQIQKVIAEARAAAASGNISNNVTTTYTVVDGNNSQGYTTYGLNNVGGENTYVTQVIDGVTTNYAQQNY